MDFKNIDKISSKTKILILILLIGFSIRLIVAFAFPNTLWPDEIFQTLEPGHRLAFGHGIITWEYRDGVRSWVFPAILAGVMKLTAGMGEGSSGYIAGVKIFLCLLSLIPIWVGFNLGDHTGGLKGAIITAGICSVWFELIFFAPKALSEVLSANVLLLGVYFGVYSLRFTPQNRLFLSGCLLGLTLVFRIQLLLAVVFVVLYIAIKQGRKALLPLGFGVFTPVLLAGTLDAFTWTYPFQSFWKISWLHLVEGKGNAWGVSPWYEYFNYLLKSWSIAWITIAILALIGMRKNPVLAGVAIIAFISHCLIGHKEYRYIYPSLIFIIILAGLGTSELIRIEFGRKLSAKMTTISVIIALLIWTGTSITLARSYNTNENFQLSKLWNHSVNTHWTQFAGNLITFEDLSKEQKLCGVGLKGIDWWWSAGYTYLHQNVPIFILKDDVEIKKLDKSFNFLVSVSDLSPELGYEKQECTSGACIYQRPGGCVPLKGYHVNKYVKAQEQGKSLILP